MQRHARPARPHAGSRSARTPLALTAALALVLTACSAPAEDGSTEGSSAAAATTTAPASPEASAPSSAGSATPEGPASSATAEAPSTEDGAGSAASPSAAAPSSHVPLTARSQEEVPMRAFAADEKPPQFVLYSFDGGYQNDRWDYFQDVAEEADAKFTVYQSGIHLLADENREFYQAPGNKPGYVNKELGGDEAEIAARVTNINEAYAQGHEIGTHMNGHLCATADYGGDKWSTKEWLDELGQFQEMFADPRGVNGYGEDFPEMQVPLSAIQGTRLPCLDGTWKELVPAFKEVGIEYDTSRGAGSVGVSWPYQDDGIWEFEMPIVYSPVLAEKGRDYPMVMAMDYNIWISGNGGEESDTEELRQFQLETYRYMYESAYHGNRAPLVFGNHFNTWAGNAFNPAVAQSMREFCGNEDTYCVTYQQMIDWLELQDPEVLAAWQEREASATGEDAAELGW